MKQFPIVRASGSHYEVGKAIGQMMAGAIHDLLGKNKDRFRERWSEILGQ